jgi:hypothetical protein
VKLSAQTATVDSTKEDFNIASFLRSEFVSKKLDSILGSSIIPSNGIPKEDHWFFATNSNFLQRSIVISTTISSTKSGKKREKDEKSESEALTCIWPNMAIFETAFWATGF